MHHQDFSGDPPAGTGSKKMPHQAAAAFHHRRGSGSGGAPAPSAGSGGGSNAADDSPPLAGSSSPMLHHQAQSQAAGAQVKKKSGFQITSVTSAQISANNSLADDTESYDDMDESHTEDLSSSEMLDVSVSRATDTGVPERSSSDETLNSLHGVDTPGLVSPNEPLHPHPIPPGSSQQQASMVNGAVHHHPQPQQLSHSHHHHHHSDNMGGAQLPLSATGGPPAGAPSLATSGPAPVSTAVPAGPSQSQRPPVLDNIIPAAMAAIQPVAAGAAAGGAAAETHLSSNVNALNASAANASGAGGQGGVSAGVGPQGSVAQGLAAAAPPQQTTQTTQAATGSRFRVVKLDTNSEPFRKGRWMCTEYYEKEIPQAAAASETARAAAEAAAAAETEVASPGLLPPQTLQPPYPQPPGQDFTSPQATQTPSQGLPGQEVVGGGGGHVLQQPPSVPQGAAGGQPPAMMPQQPMSVPYATAVAADPHQAQQQAQAGYAPPPHVPGGMLQGQGAAAGSRQPDFIQPTAPFQTQVPPQPHITPSVSMTMGLGGGGAQPAGGGPAGVAPQQLLQRQAPGAAAHANFAPAALPQQQQLHPSQAPQAPSAMPFHMAPTAHYLPLTSLQADLQPLLAPGGTFMQTSGASHHGGGGLPHVDMGSLKSAQLDDPQRLLFQHQSLLGMPRGERTVTQAIGAAGALTQMGMAAEASALVAAAAAGLRTHTVEGDDSSSGTSVVAIDNKIEQAMDLVKSHLMYAVREEVEVLKEQIKELIERNSQLEQENNLLKTLASPEQMAQFQAQVQVGGGTAVGVVGVGGSPTGATASVGVGGAVVAAAANPAQAPPAANAPSLQQQIGGGLVPNSSSSSAAANAQNAGASA